MTAVRIAAVGDLHYDGRDRASISDLVTKVNEQADILALLGDLTTHGELGQMEALLAALEPLEVPVLTVLGNHEYEAGAIDEVKEMLRKAGIEVLDGDAVEVLGVGFAGAKGFAGGFDRGALGAFGEPLMKAFVQEAMDEAMKMENALRKLGTSVKVALYHYAPIADTVRGEPEIIWPFLGSSRLIAPLEALQPDVVFHGHAHTGSLEGATPGGIPVYNVALPLLQKDGRSFMLWEAHGDAVPEDDVGRTAVAGAGSEG